MHRGIAYSKQNNFTITPAIESFRKVNELLNDNFDVDLFIENNYYLVKEYAKDVKTGFWAFTTKYERKQIIIIYNNLLQKIKNYNLSPSSNEFLKKIEEILEKLKIKIIVNDEL